MQLFVDGNTELEGCSLHALIDELVNIAALCQLIERTTEPAQMRRYTGMLSDITNTALRLVKDMCDSRWLA